jgi:DHA1 family bicyclomycin/chloramphenicol resistance-like MFS transporter
MNGMSPIAYSVDFAANAAGMTAAILGFVQWVAAGIIAPLAGLGGEHTAVPMALLMIAGAAVSMVGLLVVARPEVHRPAR